MAYVDYGIGHFCVRRRCVDGRNLFGLIRRNPSYFLAAWFPSNVIQPSQESFRLAHPPTCILKRSSDIRPIHCLKNNISFIAQILGSVANSEFPKYYKCSPSVADSKTPVKSTILVWTIMRNSHYLISKRLFATEPYLVPPYSFWWIVPPGRKAFTKTYTLFITRR